MGKPGWLRKAITPTALHNPVDGSGEVNLMTYGNINGLDSELGPQSRPYNLATVHHLGIATGLSTRHLMGATE